MNASHLDAVTYHPRIFGFLLAILILTQLPPSKPYLIGWMLFMLVYPQLLHLLLTRFEGEQDLTIPVMSVDALLTGLLISLLDFHLEAGVVLASLVGISILVVGGISLLCRLVPVCILGALAGGYLHPERFVGEASFYFVSFFSLLAYIGFIGVLVYQETRRLTVAQREEQTLRNRLEHFRALVTPFVAPQLVQPREQASRCVRKRLTVFFSDIEGFTRLMDTADEFRVAAMLDLYFGEISEVAQRHGGTVNKFLGDGVMVFFGDPVSAGAAVDALACVSMAIDMRERFSALSGHWEQEGGEPLYLRMGVHTGYCLVGEFGCALRRDYTALGSTVNLASRLEGQAGRGEVLVSAETARLILPRVLLADRGRLLLKGFSTPVPVYSVTRLLERHAEPAEARLLS